MATEVKCLITSLPNKKSMTSLKAKSFSLAAHPEFHIATVVALHTCMHSQTGSDEVGIYTNI